ncbi:MAG: hypothetical protein ACOVNO_12455, partial [Sediminibacterium sp.]
MKKMTTPIAIVCFMLMSSVIGFNNATAQSPNSTYAKDVSSEDNIIAALYNVISGAPGEPRDWER